MTSLEESLVYIATNATNEEDDDKPDEFWEHIANAYRLLNEENPEAEDMDALFAETISETKFLVFLMDGGVPGDMAVRATQLLAEDDTPWFIAEEDR